MSSTHIISLCGEITRQIHSNQTPPHVRSAMHYVHYILMLLTNKHLATPECADIIRHAEAFMSVIPLMQTQDKLENTIYLLLEHMQTTAIEVTEHRVADFRHSYFPKKIT